MSLGGSLIDSKIDDYDGTELYRGNKLPHVNGWKYNAGVQYDRSLGGGFDGGLRVDYQAFGDLYWFIDNVEKQKQVHLVSARILLSKAPWSLTLSAENIFNRRYNTDYFSSFFAGTPTDVGFPNPPRQLSAKLSLRF